MLNELWEPRKPGSKTAVGELSPVHHRQLYLPPSQPGSGFGRLTSGVTEWCVWLKRVTRGREGRETHHGNSKLELNACFSCASGPRNTCTCSQHQDPFKRPGLGSRAMHHLCLCAISKCAPWHEWRKPKCLVEPTTLLGMSGRKPGHLAKGSVRLAVLCEYGLLYFIELLRCFGRRRQQGIDPLGLFCKIRVFLMQGSCMASANFHEIMQSATSLPFNPSPPNTRRVFTNKNTPYHKHPASLAPQRVRHWLHSASDSFPPCLVHRCCQVPLLRTVLGLVPHRQEPRPTRSPGSTKLRHIHPHPNFAVVLMQLKHTHTADLYCFLQGSHERRGPGKLCTCCSRGKDRHTLCRKQLWIM